MAELLHTTLLIQILIIGAVGMVVGVVGVVTGVVGIMLYCSRQVGGF